MSMRFLETKIPPPVVVAIFGALIWGAHRKAPLATLVHDPYRALGWLVAAPGPLLVVWATLTFRKRKTTATPLNPGKATTLVVAGPYRYTRNPMYLGLALFLLGMALRLGSLSPFLLLPFFVAYLTYFQIRAEERALSRLFGAPYDKYRKTVRRWL